MDRAWKLAGGVLALFAIPRCTCEQQQTPSSPNCSAESAPHATYTLTDGYCGGQYCQMECDPGYLDCDGTSSNGCETSTDLSSIHETVMAGYASGIDVGCGSSTGSANTLGMIGSCNIECAPGWVDCNHNAADGCETQGACPVPPWPFDAGPAKVASLNLDPLGLAVCKGWYFVVDRWDLERVDPTTGDVSSVAMLPGTPAGGLVCDDTFLYFATRSDADASPPTGSLLRVSIVGAMVETLATGLDTGAGVALRANAAYFIARSGVGDAGSSLAALVLDGGGLTSWLPATETSAYKAFTLSDGDDWSLANGALWRRPLDGGSPSSTAADAASALFTVAGEPLAVVHATPTSADGGDAGGSDADTIAFVTDDSGASSLVPVGAALSTVVATSDGTSIIASESAIYAVSVSGTARVVTTSTEPIAWVTTNGGVVIWATRSTATTLASIWRAPIQ